MKFGNYDKVNHKGVIPENTLVENRDIIIANFNRMLYLINLQADTDIANLDRLYRMELSKQVIFDSFYSFICGSGTGITSRSIGGEQYESQLIKVFVEKKLRF